MRTSALLRPALLLSLALLAGALLPRAEEAWAASFTVNTTADAVDAAPGDGICATSTGACSLRAAVQETNALTGEDVITLPAGTYVLTVAGAAEELAVTGDLDVRGGLSIIGSGMMKTIIDAAGLDRVFDVREALRVRLSSLTVQNGDAPGFIGGGILIRSASSVLIDNVRIASSSAAGGAGLFNSSGNDVVIENSVIENNTSTNSGGGISNYLQTALTLTNSIVRNNFAPYHAGGIENGGTLTIDGALLDGNRAGVEGAGIYLSPGTLTVAHSTLSNNVGGATIYIQNAATAAIDNSAITQNGPSVYGTVHNETGSLVISSSTISSNDGTGVFSGTQLALEDVTIAANNGSGIYNVGHATLENVTIAGNSGTGVLSTGQSFNDIFPTLTLSNSSIVDNHFIGLAGGGDAITTVQNTLFVDNFYHNIFTGQDVPLNCSGPGITSAGHNLEDLDACGFHAVGDLINTDPLVGPLQDNGGPVPTVGLLTGSPGLDAGDDATCTAKDARGAGRPFDGDGDTIAHCDIGAFEFIPGPDTDSDGCDDLVELGPDHELGGQRDPNNFWDFFDVPTGAPPARDRSVSVGDIGGIVQRYGSYGDAAGDPLVPPPPAPAYHTAYDRGGMTPGGDPWDLLPPDGTITVGDIGAVVAQFGHSCA